MDGTTAMGSLKGWLLRQNLSLNVLLLGLLVLLILASLLVGRSAGPGFGFPDDPDLASLVFWEIRLPRTLIAALGGGVLGLTGAVIQGLLRNPLAEPGLIGTSSSAALGAVVVIYFGFSAWGILVLPLSAIGAAIIGLMMVQLIAGKGTGTTTLILAGIAINGFAGALTALALSLAPSPFAVVEITTWLMGSLENRSLIDLGVMAPFALLSIALMIPLGPALDALSLGEETASSLGFDPVRTKRLAITAIGIGIGAMVAVTGVVGFIGLIVPHLIRPFVAYRPAKLILPCTTAGAVLLLAADLLVRFSPPGPELRLGVVTALLGAPFFLYLLLKHYRSAQ